MGKYSVESLITWNGLERWIKEQVEPAWDVLSQVSSTFMKIVMSLLETIFSTTCRQSIADLKELKQLGSVSDTDSPSLIGKTNEPISVVKNPSKHMP